MRITVNTVRCIIIVAIVCLKSNLVISAIEQHRTADSFTGNVGTINEIKCYDFCKEKKTENKIIRLEMIRTTARSDDQNMEQGVVQLGTGNVKGSAANGVEINGVDHVDQVGADVVTQSDADEVVTGGFRSVDQGGADDLAQGYFDRVDQGNADDMVKAGSQNVNRGGVDRAAKDVVDRVDQGSEHGTGPGPSQDLEGEYVLRGKICGRAEISCPRSFGKFFREESENSGRIIGSCYNIHTLLRSWDLARESCKHTGGKLVSIETKSEQEHIDKIIENFSGPKDKFYIWTSGRNEHLKIGWIWEGTGRKITYSNWSRSADFKRLGVLRMDMSNRQWYAAAKIALAYSLCEIEVRCE